MKYTTQSCGFRFVFHFPCTQQSYSLCRLGRALLIQCFFLCVRLSFFSYIIFLFTSHNEQCIPVQQTNDMWLWNILSGSQRHGRNKKKWENLESFFSISFFGFTEWHVLLSQQPNGKKRNFNSIQMFWGSDPCSSMHSHVSCLFSTCLSHIFHFLSCTIRYFLDIFHEQIDILDDTFAKMRYTNGDGT